MSNRINNLHGRVRRLRTFPRRKPWTLGVLLILLLGGVILGILNPYAGVVIATVVAMLVGAAIVIFIGNKIIEENF